MITGQDILVARELRRDALARADKDRLIRQALAHSSPSRKGHQLWLARLGAQMVTWGQHLQARYASA